LDFGGLSRFDTLKLFDSTSSDNNFLGVVVYHLLAQLFSNARGAARDEDSSASEVRLASSPLDLAPGLPKKDCSENIKPHNKNLTLIIVLSS
jgi:hypothetical protein